MVTFSKPCRRGGRSPFFFFLSKTCHFYFILLKIISKDLNLCSVPGASLKSQRGDWAELEGQTGEMAPVKDKSQFISQPLVCCGFGALPSSLLLCSLTVNTEKGWAFLLSAL